MYEIPSRPEIRRVVVEPDAVEGTAAPRRFDSAGRDLSLEHPASLSDAA
jgi:hypothetical protein